MLQDAFNAVREFHYHKGIAPVQEFPTTKYSDRPYSQHVNWLLDNAVKYMRDAAEALEHQDDDPRTMRMHLILEECAECISAMMAGDEELALDGLLDLIFVCVGAGVVFDWPMDEGFYEVWRSNMTKGRTDKHRLRNKGASYQPPQLGLVLESHRERFTSTLIGQVMFPMNGDTNEACDVDGATGTSEDSSSKD